MIDRITEDKIKEAAKIVDVVGEFLTLKKKGVEYTAQCPFHEDKHVGNFMISPKRNIAKCFACGWAGDPIKFLMEYGTGMTYKDALLWLAKKYSIPCEDAKDLQYTPAPPRPLPPPLPLLVLPMALAKARQDIAGNALVQWMQTIHWDTIQRKRLDEVLSDYMIGHAKNGMTIFWQIDEQGRLRTGKMMRYYQVDHPKAGHRNKDVRYSFDFIHSALIRHRDENGEISYEPPYPHPNLYNPDTHEPQQCLFGLHLLDKWKRKDIEQTVCLVESEKTALLMAIAYGNNAKQVWMACGGLEGLSTDRLRPIIEQGRKIVLYPDRDGIAKWRAKASALHYSNLVVDCVPVQKWWKPCDGNKADIADVVIRMINERRTMTSISEVKSEVPIVAPLIDNLNLTIDET